jgi:hypothetical protein
MDDLRKYALHEAVLALNGAPYTEVVRAARAFYDFLADKNADANQAVAFDVDAVPPPPPNNTALGEADQSPAGLHRLKEFYPGHAIDGRVYAREPDDTPTRIVRREDLPPDAA